MPSFVDEIKHNLCYENRIPLKYQYPTVFIIRKHEDGVYSFIPYFYFKEKEHRYYNTFINTHINDINTRPDFNLFGFTFRIYFIKETDEVLLWCINTDTDISVALNQMQLNGTLNIYNYHFPEKFVNLENINPIFINN